MLEGWDPVLCSVWGFKLSSVLGSSVGGPVTLGKPCSFSVKICKTINVSVVKSACGSFKGPEFGSQRPCQVSHNYL